MIYNSFYGGRPGSSFNIVKSFSSIEEMVNNFKLGDSYKVVNYEEYVLIDTPNKTNADNGKIYKRGFLYNNEMGGAIYIGQIGGGTSVTDVSIDTGETEGTGTQKLMITLSDTNTPQKIGNPINYIMKVAITENYHLLVLHSDPVKRNQLKAQGQTVAWNGYEDWQDLGSVKGESGILIGKNYFLEDNPSLEDIAYAVSFLNNEHPNGLEGTDLKGKIVTIGDREGNKTAYAFDYSKDNNGAVKGWYYLGDFSGGGGTGGAGIVVGKENDAATEALASALPINGAWFIVE